MKKIFFVFGILFLTAFNLKPKPQPKISVQLWTFHKYTFTEAVEKAEALGIKYIEAYPGQLISSSLKKPINYALTTEERNAVKQLLARNNVKLIALGVIDKYYYTQQNIEAYFSFAKDMGIPFITAEPETADLDLFNQLAEKYNIKVAIHDHPKPSSHYWHVDSVVAAINGRKNLGSCADIGHWARNGLNVPECLKKLSGKIWGLHVKDVDVFDNVKAKDVLLGNGVCDLPEVFKILKQQNFNGFLSIEYEENADDNMQQVTQHKKYIEAALKNK